MPLTIKEALFWASSYLKEKGVDSYKLDSELVLSRLLYQDRVYLYAHPEELLLENLLKDYKKIIRKRGERFPLAYLLHEKEFFGRSLYIEKGVFCPRPETEIIVEEVLKTASADKIVKIFEIGLGTGAISVTLALELPLASIYGCDISEKAIYVSKKNIKRYNLENSVKIFKGHLLDAVKCANFDFIISNPPYLSKQDYLEAAAEVRKEPKRALMARDKGLSVVKKIIKLSKDYISDDGWLLIEIGDGQGSEVLEYAENQGFHAEIVKDLSKKERLLKAKKN